MACRAGRVTLAIPHNPHGWQSIGFATLSGAADTESTDARSCMQLAEPFSPQEVAIRLVTFATVDRETRVCGCRLNLTDRSAENTADRSPPAEQACNLGNRAAS